MKTQLFTRSLLAFLFVATLQAQDVTTVNAKSSDISDNLDLRAVASIFGDSKDLEDFEARLNNPKDQISNLDLNNDGKVDYLRVIESVEGNTHLIIIQSVLEKDVFQDVATVEVEKDTNNQVQVQVVGNTYMYGQNYIYEPVYVSTPLIYSNFWIGSYQPYYSPWYWNYYPTYYTYWSPYPVFRYRRHIHSHINVHHHYNYVNTRRSDRAVALYSGRRANGYERMNPNRSFVQRTSATNRYELDRTTRNINPTTRTERNNSQITNGTTRNTTNGTTRNTTRTSSNTVKEPNSATVRTPNNTSNSNTTVRTTRGTTDKITTPTTRQAPTTIQTPTRTAPPRVNTPTPNVTRTERQVPRVTPSPAPTQQVQTPRNTTVRTQQSSAPAGNRQQSSGGIQSTRRN